jgi:CubicO group peptidase (beta-lactamase class C family)
MNPTTSDSLISSLYRQVEADMLRLHVPGVALGLIHGQQTYTAGFGVTNLENPLPVDPGTLFQVGSITKTFTALAAMRLVERGRLDLDAPLRTYLPGLRLKDKSVAANVTLRHLFNHTGGWLGDYFDDSGPGDDALAKAVEKMANLPQETPLGQIWSYNNAGFYLAGRMLEVVTNQTYEAVMQENVLKPLGMSMSCFSAADAITYRVASGHDAVYPGEDRQPKVARPWWLSRSSNPLGGLISTIDDLLRYARFQMGDGFTADGTRLIQAQTLELMHTPNVPSSNGEYCGVSWFIHDVDGVRIIRHGGATNGQMATFVVVPARQFALAVLTNSDRGDEVYKPLTLWALENFLGLVDSQPQPIDVPLAQLEEYVGDYTAAATDVHLEIKDGALVLQSIPKGGFPTPDAPPPPAPPPTRLALCGPDQVIGLDEPYQGERGEFLRAADGSLAWLRVGGRVHRRL